MPLKFIPQFTMWLKAAILLLACLYACAQVDFRKYKRVSALDGFQCLVTDLVLTDDTGLITAACAARCSSTANCSSFFYLPATQQCRGCRAVYSGLALHAILAGTGYGQTCFVPDECVQGNNGCYDNVCKCEPGYPRDNTAGECATGCTTWGDTFETYMFRNLWPAPGPYGILPFQSIYPDECLERCRQNPSCLSLDHSSVLFSCEFNDVTVGSPGAVFLWDLVFFHYSRNCA